MILYFSLFYGAFLLSLWGTGKLITICEKYKIYDHPGFRKHHGRPIPTLGGLPIAVSFILFLWLGWFFDAGDLPVKVKTIIGITIAGFGAILIGIYDDIKGSTPFLKLLAQVIIAIILYYHGLTVEKITNPAGDYFDPSNLKLLVTIIWVLVITNAINLIDGLDGLASGVVFFSAMTLYLIVSIHGGGLAMYSTLILAGSVIGFLKYNFNPAKIFLGDTGSMFLGVMLSAISIIEERKGTMTITLMLPIIIMAFPILDAILVFFRRVKKGVNPFQGDRGHIHHRLLDIGFSEKQVVLVIYTICLYLGLTALLLSVAPKQFVFIVLIILGTGFFIALLLLKYFEDRGFKINGSNSLK